MCYLHCNTYTLLYFNPFNFLRLQTRLLLLLLFEQAVDCGLVHHGTVVFNNGIALLYNNSLITLRNIKFRKHFLPLTFQLGFQVPLCTVP